MKAYTESRVKTLIWEGKNLKLIDQRKLPFQQKYVNCSSFEDVAVAIKDMVVRGAPAIGVTAAYGVALAAVKFRGSDYGDFVDFLNRAINILAATRPTAVNLFWALDRMKKIISSSIKTSNKDAGKKGPGNKGSSKRDIASLAGSIVTEAENIEKDDVKINLKIGENGLAICGKSKKKLKILTHCNAGALATAGYGTALGVIRSLYFSGLVENVIVDETRPYLQGARLTAWELHQEGIPFFIISDNMSGYFMSRGEVDIIVVGADRIAANGDTANKTGTLSLSILAKYFAIPFYVVAPVSTIDMKTGTGSSIPIEQRDEREVREVLGKTIIPYYMKVKNPSFDVTPNSNITAIVTEKGLVYPPYGENISKVI